MRFGERSRSGTSVSGWTKRATAGVAYGTATGGTSSSITVGGQNYTLLTFTSSGTLTVTKAGLFDVWVQGGGGAGGGAHADLGGGGGGGGGRQIATMYLTQNATVTVGGGGAPNNQGNASFVGNSTDGYTAIAGGGNGQTVEYGQGKPGSTGGGATYSGTAVGTNYGDNYFGYNGGLGGNGTGGGGGGAGGAGQNQVGSSGGVGGAGLDVNAFIGGASNKKGGGGGGGGRGTSGGYSGGAGTDGGANGGNTGGSSAGANTAGGGGGTSQGSAGSGGSGIVYVRFKV